MCHAVLVSAGTLTLRKGVVCTEGSLRGPLTRVVRVKVSVERGGGEEVRGRQGKGSQQVSEGGGIRCW